MGKAITNRTFPLNSLIKELTVMIEKNPGGSKGIAFFTKELAKILKSYFWQNYSLISGIIDPPLDTSGDFIGQFYLNIEDLNLWQFQEIDGIQVWIFICNINGGITPTSSNCLDIDFVASENISVYDIVTQNGYIADTTNEIYENIVIGISLGDTLVTETGSARFSGQIINLAWNWDITKPIWVNGTGISQSPPDFVNDANQKWVKIIAKVLEPTRICIVDGAVIEVNR